MGFKWQNCEIQEVQRIPVNPDEFRNFTCFVAHLEGMELEKTNLRIHVVTNHGELEIYPTWSIESIRFVDSIRVGDILTEAEELDWKESFAIYINDGYSAIVKRERQGI